MSNINFEKSVENSITAKDLGDLAKELGEVGLDNILEDGLLKDIPVFSTISGLYKMGLNIRDRIFAKKILSLLLELTEISAKDRSEFINKVDNDPQFESKVGETIIMIVDKAESLQKSKLLGKLLAANIKGLITYNQFLKLSSIINRAFIPTLNSLLEIEKGDRVEEYIYEELFSLNLVTLKLVNDKSHRTNIFTREKMPLRGEKPEVFNQKLEFKISDDGYLLIESIFSK